MRIGTILSVLGATLAASAATPAVASANSITYASNLNSPSITASTSESGGEIGGPEDNITVQPNITVRATSGNVLLEAADSMTTGTGSEVQSATGNVTIVGGFGDNDSDASISLSGPIVASGNITIVVVGNICFNSISAGGTVTITAAGGTISACSGQATISATTADLTAGSGISSGFAPIMTSVSHLGASTTTGNINIDNTGALSIDQLSGLQVTGASGSVDLTNTGSVSVQTNGATISAPGGVFVQTVGSTSDITTGGQGSGSAITTSGSAVLQSGRDILLGDTNGVGSVQTGGGAILDAARDVTMNANAEIENSGGIVDVQAGRNVSMSTATGTLAGAPQIATTGGGTVTVTTGAGGTFTAASTGVDAVSAQNAPVFIEADAATIGAGITSGSARTVLTVAGINHPIDLGSKPAAALGLTQSELGLVTAAVLQIGSPGAGNLTLSAPIASSGNFNVMTLITGGSVIDGTASEAPVLTVPDLRIDAGTGIGASDDIDTAAGALAVGNASGPVAITNQQATTIGTVDGETGIANSGSTTTLVASGGLSVSQPVQSGGTITFQASDTGAPGADLTLAPGTSVASTTGDAVLLAGDNETAGAGATVTAGGAVRLECDYGDANPTDSCTINVDQGGLTGSPVALRGGDDNPATFTVANETLGGRGPLSITGAPGTSSTASVTSTSVTGSSAGGLTLDNLTSATVTGDTLTGNAGDGLAVDNSTGVLISGDTISDNGGLGIDLLHGSNHGIAAPALSFAVPTGGSTEVKGSMTGVGGHVYHLAFFDNPTCDASGFAEGKSALGTDDVTADASGHASFDVTLPAASAAADAVAATATDQSSSETSAFSRCIQRSDLAVGLTATPNPAIVGGPLTYTVTVKNNGPNSSSGSTLIDTLPHGVPLVSVSPGCVAATGTVTCALGGMAAGASTAITITLKAPGSPGILTDTAAVTGREQDINLVNNTAVGAVAVVLPAAAIRSLSVKPKRFKAASSGGSTAVRGRGVTVSYSDTRAARTTFAVDQVLAGRMSGKKCAAPSKRNRHGRPCSRYVRMRGSFAHTDRAGGNSLRFTGRLGGHKLPRGLYRLDATPAAGGRAGVTATVLFWIIS